MKQQDTKNPNKIIFHNKRIWQYLFVFAFSAKSFAIAFVFLVKAFGRTIFLQRFSAIFVLGLCD